MHVSDAHVRKPGGVGGLKRLLRQPARSPGQVAHAIVWIEREQGIGDLRIVRSDEAGNAVARSTASAKFFKACWLDPPVSA